LKDCHEQTRNKSIHKLSKSLNQDNQGSDNIGREITECGFGILLAWLEKQNRAIVIIFIHKINQAPVSG